RDPLEACATRPAGRGSEGVPVIYDGQVEFCIDRYETTWGEYGDFQDGLALAPPTIPPACAGIIDDFEPLSYARPDVADIRQYPVGGVSWCQAATYCATVGKRLCGAIGARGAEPLPPADVADPTRSEWMEACATRSNRSYPYAQTQYDESACNGMDGDGPVKSSVVGAYATCKSAFEVYDLIGNIQEWEDSCEPDPPGATPGQRRETRCVLRGGAWSLGGSYQTCAFTSEWFKRSPVVDTDRVSQNGIRCCWDPE
ncbi:MAG: hypothetical protein EOO75_12605, partial [Myxococcales bacterium]